MKENKHWRRKYIPDAHRIEAAWMRLAACPHLSKYMVYRDIKIAHALPTMDVHGQHAVHMGI
jgi:hypothetical protein